MIQNILINSILNSFKKKKKKLKKLKKHKKFIKYYNKHKSYNIKYKYKKNKYKKNKYKKNKYKKNKYKKNKRRNYNTKPQKMFVKIKNKHKRLLIKPLKRNKIFKNVIFFIFKYFIILKMFNFLIKNTLEKKKPTLYQSYNFNFLIIFSKIKKFHKSLNLLNLMNLAMKNLKKTKGRFFISLIPLLRTLRYFFNKKIIEGYKLICKGRFSRRQRSSKKVFQEGNISFGNIESKTDYIFKDVVLKNSLCGFKLYVTYNRDRHKKISFNKQ